MEKSRLEQLREKNKVFMRQKKWEENREETDKEFEEEWL